MYTVKISETKRQTDTQNLKDGGKGAKNGCKAGPIACCSCYRVDVQAPAAPAESACVLAGTHRVRKCYKIAGYASVLSVPLARKGNILNAAVAAVNDGLGLGTLEAYCSTHEPKHKNPKP